MTPETPVAPVLPFRPVWMISLLLAVSGLVTFMIGVTGAHPERAWQAYLINFLLWSAIAQGGFLFSALMHVTRARWSGTMSGAAEAFAAFFPISFLLFLGLFAGVRSLFPWVGQDLHGKEIWLNLPFLFTRDALGLLTLYGVGLGYLYYSLGERLAAGSAKDAGDPMRTRILKRFLRNGMDASTRASRKTLFAVLYIIAFAMVLSLIGFDLVMGMDPHWYSTLFGAYTFVKAFYAGLGGLIILSACLHRRALQPVNLAPSHFHDVGKLFFGFCLVWADFFYCQLVVIWYGNIPEESAYVIKRTLAAPYQPLAWTVFVVAFVLPFFILLNRKIKTRPIPMVGLCVLVLTGIWLEHLLLLGPALIPHQKTLPLGPTDGVITLGFLGIMMLVVTVFLNRFPELVVCAGGRSPSKKEEH